MNNPILELARDPQATADRLAALPAIPGIQIAGLVNGEITVGAAGSADLETGQPVGPDTRFRPGSVTKLLTASLVLGCVADDLLGLDDPVTRFVPGPWSDVLVRHLISHQSGIDAGDLFLDTGDGDDALAKYVERLHTAGTLFPAGTTFSYNNAGFVLAGRVVEIVLGQTWDAALTDRVLDPAGMTDTGFTTGSAAADDPGIARPHLVQGGTPIPQPRDLDRPRGLDRAMATRAMGPAGGTLVSTASDLARHVRAQLNTPGTEIMRTLHASAPGGVRTMLGAGLGWMVCANAAQRSVRIGGAYPGQSAVIALDPETGTAVVAMSNSDQGVHAVTALLDAAGPTEEQSRTEPAPADLSGYTGRYLSHVCPVDVALVAGQLVSSTPGLPDTALTPADRITFTAANGPVAFFDFQDGAPQYLRALMRVWRRVSN